MVDNTTNLDLNKKLNNANIQGFENADITENQSFSTSNSSDIQVETDYSDVQPETVSSDNTENPVNCLSLTVRKDYSLSVVKHVIVRTWKTTWRVALSIFLLNFLSFFF